MCASSVFFFSSFNMIIPELPAYLTQLGGEDYKGLIISLFTLTAMLSRPFSGKLADKVGRIPVMIFGSAICFIASGLYPLIGGVASFLLLRFFHGFSTGFKPTGTSAYVADIIPANKRGEAMGILGIFNSTGMALGPSIGGWIAANYTTDVLFYTSAAFGLMSVLVLVGLKETVKKPEPFSPKLLKMKVSEFYEPRVVGPSVTMMLTVFSFGIVLTIIPDFSVHLGFENKGIFFTVFVIASLFIRLIAGRASDRFGRVKVLRFSSISVSIAMLLIGFASTQWHLIGAAILFGMAVGTNSPTVFAWTIDLSREEARGKAMATMYIALEVGIGTGALLSAAIYDNDPANFSWAFWVGSISAFIAFLYLFTWEKRYQHKYE
jgi:MFS family permease